MEQKILRLNVEKFATLLGAAVGTVENSCGDLLREYDLRYSILEDKEFKETLLEVIKVIDDDSALSVSGRKRHTDWEMGWSENLTAFKNSNYDFQALTPKYMHKHAVRRLFSSYIKPLDGRFEANFYTVYRNYIFKQFLDRFDSVFEFGCGTGYNLAILAQLYPEKQIHGLDWTKASVEIVNSMAKAHDFNLSGHLFDFFNPDYSLVVNPNSAFITFNSLEQLGSEYRPFLEFILEKKPAICINSEPLFELYDDNDLLDYLAIKYHKKRNYLNGYLGTIRELESQGRIRILHEQRVHSGNLFHEGYSLVIWQVVS